MYTRELKKLQNIRMPEADKARIAEMLAQKRGTPHRYQHRPMAILVAALAFCILCTACGVAAQYFIERRNLAAFWLWEDARVLDASVETDFGSIYYASITDHRLFVMCRLADLTGNGVTAEESFTAIFPDGTEYPLAVQNQAWSDVYTCDTATVDWYVQYGAVDVPTVDTLTLRYDKTGEETTLSLEKPDTEIAAYRTDGVQIRAAQLGSSCPAVAVSIRVEKNFGNRWLAEPEKMYFTVGIGAVNADGTVYHTACGLQPIGGEKRETCVIGLFTPTDDFPDTNFTHAEMQMEEMYMNCFLQPEYTMREAERLDDLVGEKIRLPFDKSIEITDCWQTEEGDAICLESITDPSEDFEKILCMPDGTVWYNSRGKRIEENGVWHDCFTKGSGKTTEQYQTYSEQAKKSGKVLFFVSRAGFQLENLEKIEK